MVSRFIMTVFALTGFVVLPVFAGEDMLPQKRELIKELMRVVDARNLAVKQMNAGLENLKDATLPQLLDAGMKQQFNASKLAEVSQETKDAAIKKYSARIVDRIRKGISEKLDVGGLTEGIYFDLYGKYFDEKELQAIIDFYRSPAGSKAISLMPQISAEAMRSVGDATNKVMIDIYMNTMKEEMVSLAEELFPSECDED